MNSRRRDLPPLTIRLSNLFVICSLFAFTGCTSTYRVTTLESRPNDITLQKFFDRTAGGRWTIDFVNGQERTATILRAPADSVTLVVAEDTITLSVTEIRFVKKKHYLFGVLVYPPMATLAGAFFGAGLGQAISGGDGWSGYSGFVAGIAIGAAGGLALGILNPPETTYEFAVSK